MKYGHGQKAEFWKFQNYKVIYLTSRFTASSSKLDCHLVLPIDERTDLILLFGAHYKEYPILNKMTQDFLSIQDTSVARGVAVCNWCKNEKNRSYLDLGVYSSEIRNVPMFNHIYFSPIHMNCSPARENQRSTQSSYSGIVFWTNWGFPEQPALLQLPLVQYSIMTSDAGISYNVHQNTLPSRV
ncbi:3339_t:CDS:2 [Entrophospora sp. SA101]|nr:3339_t:CDS:2 [Entrophospora sp. SA101]